MQTAYSDKTDNETLSSLSNQSQLNSITNSSVAPAEKQQLKGKLFDTEKEIVEGKKKVRIFLMLLILCLISTFITSFKLFSTFAPLLNDIENKISIAVEEIFPEELEIEIKDGKASTNVTEPYYLTISQSTLNRISGEKTEDTPASKIRLLAIDTKAGIEEFEKYQSLMLLTENNLVFYDDDEGVSVESLRGYPDMTINKTFVLSKISEFRDEFYIIEILKVMLYLSPFIILLGYFLIYLIDILIGAFLAWVINKVLQTGLKYSNLLRLTAPLYILTAFILLLIDLIEDLSLYRFLISGAMDVFTLSAVYVFLKQYRDASASRYIFIRFILGILALPILLIIDVVRSQRTAGKKVMYMILVPLMFIFTWILGYITLFYALNNISYQAGIRDKLIGVPISGTSMMPTIRDGEYVTLNSPQKYGIERGDIVTFKNIETGGLSYIKRVIGLEGEEISIQNGSVVINGQTLKEPYVYQNDPTYGNTFLQECETIKIPKGKIAVFGDNRLVSSDSRIIGFIDKKDIDGVMKTGIKISFQSENNSSGILYNFFDDKKFISLLNKKRAEYSAAPLVYQDKLSSVADLRVSAIQNDTEGWKSSSPSIQKLAGDSGYKYLIITELVTFGNLTEEQLLNQIAESAYYKNDFLSGNFSEIGVGVSKVKNKSCEYQAYSVIIGNPADPSYELNAYTSWSNDVDIINNHITILQGLRYDPGIDTDETDLLITELEESLLIAQMVQSRIENNEGFSETEQKAVGYYNNQSSVLTDKLIDYYSRNIGLITDEQTRKMVEEVLPKSSEFNLLSNQVKLMFSRGEYQEQLKGSQQLIELAADNSELAIGYYWSGLSKYKLKKYSDAQKDLNKAAEMDSDYSAPYVTLSALSFDNGEYEQGLVYAMRCVELDPDYGWCHNNLGLAYIYLDRKTEAIEEFQKATELDPSSYVFTENLKRAKEY